MSVLPHEQMTIEPARLRRGDTVAAVSLSWGGPGTFPHRYAAGKRQFGDVWLPRRRSLPRAARRGMARCILNPIGVCRS